MRFSKSFTVEGGIDRVFELIQAFISGMKFKLEHADKPNTLVLKRGSKHPLSFKIENYRTELTISLKQSGDKVHVLCDYNVTPLAVYTPSDKSTLESEVNKLEHFLKISL